MNESNETMTKVHEYIANRMEEIRKCFLNAKVSVLIRNPDIKDGDLYLSADDTLKVLTAIKRLEDKKNENVSKHNSL